MTHRDEDRMMLHACVGWADTHHEEAEEMSWPRPFERMLSDLEGERFYELTDKQRTWVKDVHEKLFDQPEYLNLFSSGKVPVGEYGKTPTPEVLKRPLPKKPPGRTT